MKVLVRPFCGLLLLVATACSPATPATSIVVFGKIWTGDPAHPYAEAVAIAGDTIAAVGDSATIAERIERGTEVFHAPGLVVPGLIDAHTHFIDGGFQLAQIDLRDARTPEEFVRRIAEHARALPRGTWILGGDWDHEWWPGGPLPTRAMIDSVTPDHPVWISRLDGHMSLANTAALRLAGVTRASREPAGGVIVRDAAGEPTGVLKDNAMALVQGAVPVRTAEATDSALARAMRHAASLGITAVGHVSAGWGDLGAYRRLDQRGMMTTRVAIYPPFEWWRAVADSAAAMGSGSDWIRLQGVKGYVDGSLGSTTALLYGTYLDDPRSHGQQVTATADIAAYVGGADSAGLQVAVHAIGDSANGLLLAIFDSVAKAHGTRDRRFRIEHAQHLDPRAIAAMGRQQVIASMQPYHVIDDGRWAGKRLDARRLAGTYAFRDLLGSGTTLAFGSDWTVATLDPLWGIYAAVTRRTLDDRNPDGWIPAQKIGVEEVLRAYTAGSAFAIRREDRIGSLVPGKFADVVILDHDLFAVAPESLATVRVATTIAGGRVVYRR